MLIDPGLQGVNIHFVLSFEIEEQRASDKRYYLSTREIKKFNVIINGQNFLDQPVTNDLIRYDNIREIATGEEDY